jgi:hypothetical protein|nr:MAG TPA: hypothetical protein [Caudoviricetes sp.]
MNDIVISKNLPELRKNAALMVQRPKAGQKAIEVRRALAELPETLSGLSEQEREIFSASVKKQICEYDNALELTAYIKPLFKYIAKDVGYTIPSKEEEWKYIQTRILDILRKYFANLTLNDIKLAFELTAIGELDVFLPKNKDGKADRGHYQNFNAEYFSKILHAYQEKQGCVFEKVFKNTSTIAIADNSAKVAQNKFRKLLVYAFYHYKYRGYMLDLSAPQQIMLYSILHNLGFITAVLSDDDLKRSMAEVRKQIAMNIIKPFQAGIIKARGVEHDAVKAGAVKFAQYRAIVECFDELLSNEIQITDYIHL